MHSADASSSKASSTMEAQQVESSTPQEDDSNTTDTDGVDNTTSTKTAKKQSREASETQLQTRFRFYEPEESKEEKNENSKTKATTNRFSFYDDITRQELAALDKHLRQQRSHMIASANPNPPHKITTPKNALKENTPGAAAAAKVSGTSERPGKPTKKNLRAIDTSMGSADEILRSLQETEEQRFQILNTSTNVTAMPSNNHQRMTTGYVPSSDDSGSNPYEDAIKEALSLLRKHKSPVGTPAGPEAVPRVLPESVHVSGSADPNAATLTSAGTRNLRTPREKDKLLQHRKNANDDDDEHDAEIGKKDLVITKGASAGKSSLFLEVNDDDDIMAAVNAANPSSPTVVEDLTDAYEEHKLKAKQRQERMAQYASRLQEFKNSLPAEAMEQHWPHPSITNSQSNVESYVIGQDDSRIGGAQDPIHCMSTIPHVHSNNEDSVGISELSLSTKEHVEAEVQRGVERVLLAILERASGSSGRSIQSGSAKGHSQAASSGDPYRFCNESHSESNLLPMNDALLRAMEELGLNPKGPESDFFFPISGTAITREDPPKLKTKNSAETDGSGFSSKKSATSVVDELLAEDEEAIETIEVNMDVFDLDQDNRTHCESMMAALGSPAGGSAVTHFGHHSWGPREEKKLPDSQEKLSKTASATLHGEETNNNSDDNNEDDNHENNDDLFEGEEEDESQADSQVMTGVLGPLSKKAGGTTGVVLDIGQAEESPVQGSAALEGGRSKNKYGPYSSSLGYVSAALTVEEEEALRVVRERGKQREGNGSKSDLADDDDFDDMVDDDDDKEEEDDFDEDLDVEDDLEATELMRTLCAHLLPFGVDQKSNHLLEAIPDWDETNPNEAGYRIIRLSKSQLRRVERAFEIMITGLKRNSERELNGVEESGDAKFARELQEAERWLDESEEQQQLISTSSDKGQKFARDQATVVAAGDEAAAPTAVLKVTHQDAEEDCGHPLFPGVKATGRGEMGDLEYFNLPIIFKSHVTGFEPTKDLILEPGNVVAGQYLVESELGSAAFSTAYRCIDLSSDSEDGHDEVCLKVIKNTKDFFDQSLDEIKILELLRQTGQVHENHIVEMKCFFYYREHLIIVTELLRQNLFEFGKFILDNNEEPYFTIPRLAYVTRQALIALRFVHSLGLVHSDVKPENILLGSYSRAQIKLIDFGSSCYLTDRQSSYIQSRSYRAPEVVLGLPYDGKIDIWSLGCVVAEMYTGEVTFQNDSIVSMLSRIEAICGPFPRHMIAQGRQSSRFFTNSGLLYEVVDDSERGSGKSAPGPHDDDDDTSDAASSMQFDIFQPKNTRLSARLGFDSDLMDNIDFTTETQLRNISADPERQEQQMLTDFVRKLLTIDPDGRPTAEEALQHPWMQFAANLTEEQIKYPAS